MQHGQVLMLKRGAARGEPVWAYRYRTGGRDSRRLQRGGFASEREARLALERELALVRRRQRLGIVTLAQLVELYLAQHDAQPETTAKLGWLLDKSVAVFGARPIAELTAPEIAAWRMTIAKGHRFEATQALRQVLARAIVWELLDVNVAKQGVDNPQPEPREMCPFESHDQLRQLAIAIGPYFGPVVLFAAATGLRPGEWIALEWRDIRPRAAPRARTPLLLLPAPEVHQDQARARRPTPTDRA